MTPKTLAKVKAAEEARDAAISDQVLKARQLLEAQQQMGHHQGARDAFHAQQQQKGNAAAEQSGADACPRCPAPLTCPACPPPRPPCPAQKACPEGDDAWLPAWVVVRSEQFAAEVLLAWSAFVTVLRDTLDTFGMLERADELWARAGEVVQPYYSSASQLATSAFNWVWEKFTMLTGLVAE